MKNLMTGLACMMATSWIFTVAAPATAQILGARPGYSNAVMKQERNRQEFQAKLRAYKVQQAADQDKAVNAAK